MKDYPYVPGWRQNKENNKPAIKHSVLMFTTHGIAEGEWVGNEWVQYRWSCKVKDTDVLYWMHLEDLTQLEKEGDCFQQEQPEENKLPNKRTRVNYAICKLQSFKPLREAIVLDDYVYDEGKCYRENLLNYIHAIPERRLMEIRSYLKEKGWWPYNDDADWMEQEQLGVDLSEETLREGFHTIDRKCFDEGVSGWQREKLIARHFYELARLKYEK